MTSRTIPDAQGHPGSVSYATPEPCLICGANSVIRVDGFCLHLPCWQMTTAADRELWTGLAAPTVGVATPTAPATPPPPPTRGTPLGERTTQTSPSTPKSTAKETPTASSGLPAIAAVVGASQTWVSDGRVVPTPQDITHLGELHEFGQALRLGMDTRRGPAAGQLWLTQEAAYQWGVDLSAAAQETDSEKIKSLTDEVTAQSEFLVHARAQGWVAGDEESGLSRWTRVHPDNQHEALWLVLVPCLGDDTLVAGDPEPAELATRLGRLAQVLRFPYRITPAITGSDHMRSLRKNSREEFWPHEPCAPAEMGNVEPAMSWTRTPTTEESEHTWLHAYDRGGSYLSALAGLDFGVGVPTHHPEGVAFDPKVPGYWRIEVPESGDWRMPNVLDPATIGAGRTRWVTTPALELAYQMDLEVEVQEAFTWSKKARLLDPWYEAMRDARAELTEADDPVSAAVLKTVKAIYTRTFGMMGSKAHMAGREGYAPERRHMIIAQSNANMIRRIRMIGQTTGRWPVAVDTDTIYYTSNEADPDKAWPLADQPENKRFYGRRLGHYKPEASGELEYQLQFLNGKAYRGKDALMGSDL